MAIVSLDEARHDADDARDAADDARDDAEDLRGESDPAAAVPTRLATYLQTFATRSEPETALLYCADSFADLAEFLALAEFAEDVRDALAAPVVVASFHPDYRFAGQDDPLVDAIHRSPVPVIHLLRERSIERARATYPALDEIPLRNRDRAHALGAAFFERYRRVVPPAQGEGLR